jgi:hypothetical protein
MNTVLDLLRASTNRRRVAIPAFEPIRPATQAMSPENAAFRRGTLQQGRDSLQGGGGRDGDPGPQGPAGADGADGADGAPGADGADGADGAPGFGFNSGDGFAYEEYTICSSGSPATRWFATWTSDPN